MGSIYPAEQYNKAFRSQRLQNWEHPAEDKEYRTSVRAGTLRARSGRTQFIVNDKGHLLSPRRKVPAAFTTHNLQEFQRSSARWPQPNTTIRKGGSATMGYKGIITNYLPR